MNKQIALPCCGSCKHFSYNETIDRDCCNNKKAILLYLTSFPARICAANYYSPRKPIPITGLSEVKKLIKDAYIDALSLDADEHYSYRENYIKEMTDKYMKSLGDK